MITRNQLVPNLNELQTTDVFGSPRGEQIITQGTPERMEMVRLGNSWVIRTAAIACVTAIPTTTASSYLWNGEPSGGKSYVIDNIGWICTTSAAAASMFGLLLCLNKAPLTAAPATADTLNIATLNGRGYGGNAATGHTATVVDDNWWSVGNSGNTNALTATGGYTLWCVLEGSVIITPGRILGLACIAVNTTAAGKFIIQYHEVQIPNVTS
jgi:hypothetical protein